MKKSLFWVLATILTCGIALTSCEKGGGNSELLLGNWFLSQESESYGDKKISYALFSFGEDGVFTQRVYTIFPDEPAHYSERVFRHSIYTVDNSAGTVTFDDGEDVQTFRYQFNGSELSLSEMNPGNVAVLHRPTAVELEKAKTYDQFISSDDYIGRWFYTNTFGDLTLHGMLNFDENGRLEHVIYTVYSESDCTRKSSTMLYNEYDGEYHVLEIHEPKDYSVSTLYYWGIVNDHLKLENYEDEDNLLDCHPLSPADIELMAKLDKLVK